jgi:hypothetical protein
MTTKARSYKKFLTSIAAMDSAAMAEGAFPGDPTQETIDQVEGNALGAWEATLYVTVTIGPVGKACEVQVWASVSSNDSTYTDYAYTGLSVRFAAGETGMKKAGILPLEDPYTKLKLKSIDAGCTAGLSVRPAVPEENFVSV